MEVFKLYIKADNKYVSYGCGSVEYIMELLNDYLVISDMHGHNDREFKIERLSLKEIFLRK